MVSPLLLSVACGRLGYDALPAYDRGDLQKEAGSAGLGGTPNSPIVKDGGRARPDGRAVGGASGVRDATLSGDARPGAPTDATPDGSRGTTTQDSGADSGSLSLGVGLVGYWTFNDGSGGLAIDSSGNSNLGTMESLSQSDWRTGIQGGAVLLGAAWMKTAFTPSLNTIMTQMSIAGWVNVVGTRPGTGTILQRQVGTTSAAHFSLRLQAGQVDFGGVGFGPCETAALVPSQQWVHVAATFNGTTLVVYIDGQSQATCPASAVIGTDTTPITVGAALTTAGPTAVVDQLPSTTVDEVVLYSRALSGREVRALATGSLPLP